MSQRRDAVNGLFVTLCVAVLTGVTALGEQKALPLLVAGEAISIVWLLYINSFKALNTAKFDVINQIEGQFQVRPFGREWEILQHDESHYLKETTIERLIAIVFIILYCFLMLGVFFNV